MDVLLHDLHRGAKPLSRMVYNYGGRHALGWSGRALQYGVGGAGYLTGLAIKGIGEHGVKTAWWLTRLVPYAGASAYNGTSRLIRRRFGTGIGHIPHPPIGYHFRGARPAWMDWRQHHPGTWAPCPIPAKYIPRKYRPDNFNAYNMYNSLEIHSHDWYTQAANELSLKVDQVFNSLLEEYQTPRTDRFGNFLDAQGNLVPPVFNPTTGAVNAPPDTAFKSPALYRALMSNDQNEVNAAHNALRSRAMEHVQLEHVHQLELLERRKAEKANKKIMHEVARLHAVEQWLEIWNDVVFKDTYTRESQFLKWFLDMFTGSD